MNYQLRGFRASFIIHAFLLLAVVALISPGMRISKPVEINFSIDSPSAGSALKTAPSQKGNEMKARERPRLKPRVAAIKAEQLQKKAAPRQVTETSEKAAACLAPASEEPVNASPLPAEGTAGTAGNEIEPDGADSASGQSHDSEEMDQYYLKEHFMYIRNIVQKKLSYPRIARQMGWQGKVIIAFIVSIDGKAKNIEIRESSGIELLDRNAVTAVHDASPFPKPPIEAKLIIPISYTLD